MKDYCIGCKYCRLLSVVEDTHACHYYLDTGLKPPYTETGCVARHILTAAERAEDVARRRSTGYIAPTKRRQIEEDYIYDSRGALTGWYPARED